MTSIWSNIRQFLEQHLSADEFSQWVQPVKARILDANHLILQVPTRFHSEWIREHYLPLVYAHCEQERIPVQIRLRVPAKGERALPLSLPRLITSPSLLPVPFVRHTLSLTTPFLLKDLRASEKPIYSKP
jgi:chromosomal replication initiation ATPase DnaA